MTTKYIDNETFSEKLEPKNEEVLNLNSISMYKERNNDFGKEMILMNINFEKPSNYLT
jgi:hypothetical protein